MSYFIFNTVFASDNDIQRVGVSLIFSGGTEAYQYFRGGRGVPENFQ